MRIIQFYHLPILIKNVIIFIIHQVPIFIHLINQFILILILHIHIYFVVIPNLVHILQLYLAIVDRLLVIHIIRFSHLFRTLYYFLSTVHKLIQIVLIIISFFLFLLLFLFFILFFLIMFVYQLLSHELIRLPLNWNSLAFTLLLNLLYLLFANLASQPLTIVLALSLT